MGSFRVDGYHMDETPKDAVVIELYPNNLIGQRRYAGTDSTLGASNYNMISGTNPLGVITIKLDGV